MKNYILAVFILLLTISLNAQDFSGGFLFGASGSQVDGDVQSGYKKPGLLAGAWVSMPFSQSLDLKIETYYIGKGAVDNQEQADGTVFQNFKTSLHYIEMPFLLNINIHPKIDLAFGIAPSYLFSHKLTSRKQLVDKSSYSMNNFDFQGMGQVDFFLTEKISSSIRFSYSLVDIRKEDLAVWYNNNISIAFRYKL